MTSVGFAYFCWRRNNPPDAIPPGMRWDGNNLVGTPTLPGKYLVSVPGVALATFAVTVVPRNLL